MMLQVPLITIVITTFRRPKLLKEAIESVLYQTYPHFNVWVYDDASNDETEEVVKGFQSLDPRVHYHKGTKNQGVLALWNLALSNIETLYCSFLADDDSLAPSFFEETLKGFQDDPEAGFSASSIFVKSSKGKLKTVKATQPKRSVFPAPSTASLLKIGPLNTTAMIFRVNALKSIGGIDPDTTYCFDTAIQLKLSLHFSFVFNPLPLGIFSLHDDAASSKCSLKQMLPSLKRVECMFIHHPKLHKQWLLFEEKVLTGFWLRALVHRDFESAFLFSEVQKNDFKKPSKASFSHKTTSFLQAYPTAWKAMMQCRQLRRQLRHLFTG